MPTSKTPLILGLLLLVSILITAGMYSWQNKQITELTTTIENLEAALDVANNDEVTPPPAPTPEPVVVEETDTEDETTASDDAEIEDDENQPTGNTDRLPDFTTVGTTYDIQEGADLIDSVTMSVLQERNERITGSYMAVSATNPRIFYLSTSQSGDDAITTSRLYKYDAERDKLVELYWQRNNKPLWIFGLMGNDLIVHEITTDEEINACFNPWLSEDIQSLDLEAPSEGTHEYEVSDTITTRERANLSGC